MNRRAILTGLSLLLTGAAAAPAPATRPKPKPALAAVPIARLSLGWWKDRHQAKLAELRRGPVDLVWLGDSITQNWEKPEYAAAWQHFYGDRRAVNLGFTGDATSHLLWRLQNGEIDAIAPKAAIILIGANNLGRLHWPTADDLLGIGAVVSEVHRRLPRTRILLLGVLPCDRGPWVAETTRQINAGLKQRYDSASGVACLDVGGLFLRNGALDHALFADQPPDPALHPSPEGQARMAAAIEPTLAMLMNDRNHLAK